MFVLLLYRVDKETSNICKLHAGEHVIGRGPLLQCTSKKVSRNHGIIRVTEEEGAFLISTHKNPCFLRAQNTQHMTIVKNGCSVSLSNGDKIALLPDEYWFKVQIVSTLDNENNNVLNSQPVVNNTSNIPTSNSTPLDKTDATSISTSVLHDTTDLNISGCKRNYPDQIGEVQRKKTKINDKVPEISTSQRNTCNQENVDEISIVRSPSPELSGIENIDSRLSPNVENNEACNNVLDENCSSRCSSPDLLQDFPCESNVVRDMSHRNSVQSEQANLNNIIPDTSNVNNVQSEVNSSVSSQITDHRKNILSQTCENSANVILNDLCENVQPNLDRHENLEECNVAATSSPITRNVESLNIETIRQTSRDLNLEENDARDSEENYQQIDNTCDNQDANNEAIKMEVDGGNISVKEVQYENDNEVEVKIEKKNDDNEIQNVTKVENVEEDNVDNPDNGQDNQPSTSGNNATRRERCWYGSQCYRKNPAHKSEYSHPDDDDYNSDPNDPRRICAYGANCYRRNKLHRQQYWHPNSIRDRTAGNSTTGNSTSPTLRKRRKTPKDTKLKSDSEDDYDYSDPFINDGSSDEYQAETDDSDSDYNDDDADDDFEENSEENRVLLREARKFTRGGKNKD